MNKQFLKNLKLIVVIAAVLGFAGVLLYLAYSFSLMWQAMAAGFTIGFLLILLFLLFIALIYVGIRILWIQRELNKCRLEVEILKKKLAEEKLKNDSKIE